MDKNGIKNGIFKTDIKPENSIQTYVQYEIYDPITLRTLNLSGVCRIDFLIDSKTNKVFINEPNTIPGSLAFYLWEPAGKGYKNLLSDMINIAIKEYKEKSKKTYSFDSNILSNYNGLKGSKGKLKR